MLSIFPQKNGINMVKVTSCFFCKKDFFYNNVSSKIRKYCSIKCTKTKLGKGFWKSNPSFEKKIDKIKIEFEKKAIKKEGCWDWKGYKLSSGYASIYYESKNNGAHRISWMIKNNRPIPNGMLVCHNCDNPVCTNPDHLFLGTAKENTQDMIKKSRDNRPKGEMRYNAILTIEKVIKIKQLLLEGLLSQYKIALLFGVGRGAIQDIKRGKSWKDI